MVRANKCSERPSGPLETRLSQVETGPLSFAHECLHKNTFIPTYIPLQGCFGKNLSPAYADLIASFHEKFIALQEYARDFLNIEVSTTWKIHVISCHVEQWLDRHPVGLGVFAEQMSEASHKDSHALHSLGKPTPPMQQS